MCIAERTYTCQHVDQYFALQQKQITEMRSDATCQCRFSLGNNKLITCI